MTQVNFGIDQLFKFKVITCKRKSTDTEDLPQLKVITKSQTYIT